MLVLERVLWLKNHRSPSPMDLWNVRIKMVHLASRWFISHQDGSLKIRDPKTDLEKRLEPCEWQSLPQSKPSGEHNELMILPTIRLIEGIRLTSSVHS